MILTFEIFEVIDLNKDPSFLGGDSGSFLISFTRDSASCFCGSSFSIGFSSITPSFTTSSFSGSAIVSSFSSVSFDSFFVQDFNLSFNFAQNTR